MTKGQAIKDNKYNTWNCFLKAISIDDLAEMLSEIPCERCICHEYCGKSNNDLTCQETIRQWLDTEIDE